MSIKSLEENHNASDLMIEGVKYMVSMLFGPNKDGPGRFSLGFFSHLLKEYSKLWHLWGIMWKTIRKKWKINSFP